MATYDQSGEHATSIIYQADGMTVREQVLPNGSRLAYGFDDESRSVSVTQSTSVGEENSTVKCYTYGLVTELHSGNNIVKYTYDAKRRIQKVELNGVPIVDYSYDILDATEETEASMRCTTYLPSDAKIITTTELGGTQVREIKKFDNEDNAEPSTTISLEYDARGNMTKRHSTSSRETTFEEFIYGELDVPTKYTHSKVRNGNTDIVVDEEYKYCYDGLLSEKIERRADDSSVTYKYTYGETSGRRLQSIAVQDIVIRPKIDHLGRYVGKETDRSEAMIMKDRIAYRKVGDHATNQVSSMSFKDGRFFNYTYDEMGNITAVCENGELVVRYTYDDLCRLVREDNKRLNKTVVFVYDNNGNILVRREYNFTLMSQERLAETAETPETFLYAYNGDRMVSFDGKDCTYNDMGCPTIYLGKSMEWDAYGRLTKIGDDEVKFVYDAFGKRIYKTKDGHSTRYVYNSDGNLIYQEHRSVGVSFYYDHTGVMGMKYNGNIYFYRKNAQGDIIGLVDSNGDLIVSYVYDAWGNHRVKAGTVDISNLAVYNAHVGNVNPFRYRGYYFDTETGFYYLPARYYDPATGRFISQDDHAYLDPETINGLNLYAYCLNNPVMCFDPTGHMPEWVMWTIGGVLLAASIALTIFTAGAAAGTIAASIHAIALGATISGLTSAAIGTVAGGLTYSNGTVSWSWAGAAEGFMWGAVTGVISGAAGAALSSVGSNLINASKFAKLAKWNKAIHIASQGLINSAIAGGLTAAQGLITNSFSWGSVLTSMAFGFAGGLVSPTSWGEGLKNVLIGIGLGLGESSVGEFIEIQQSYCYSNANRFMVY